jgi:hypothetical protein
VIIVKLTYAPYTTESSLLNNLFAPNVALELSGTIMLEASFVWYVFSLCLSPATSDEDAQSASSMILASGLSRECSYPGTWVVAFALAFFDVKLDRITVFLRALPVLALFAID